MGVRYLLGILLTLLIVTCGGGGGSGSPGLPGPSGLAATYDPSSLQITLTWTPPTGTFQGYNLEAAVGTQAFQPVNTELIDSSATGLFLTFQSMPPELTTFQFRLQAVRGTANSPWSNAASLQTPLLAPSLASAEFVPVSRAVNLNWTETSSMAVLVRIERAPADNGGAATGPWATLATQAAQVQAFTDSTILERGRYIYRVTNLNGSAASEPYLIAMPTAIPLFLPVNLTGTTLPQGIQLRWENLSVAGTGITVLRGAGRQDPTTVLATLGPQTQSYTDTTVGFGYYSYALSLTDGNQVVTTPSLRASAPNPLGATTLSPTLVANQPGWSGAAMRPDGGWVLGVNDGPLGIPASPGRWPQWRATDLVSGSRDLLQINGQGWPELLYFRSDPQALGKAALDRVAFDGTDWTETPLAGSLPTSYAAPPDGAWRLDARGGLHAVLTTYDLSTDYKVPTSSYLHASASGVEVTALATLLPGRPLSRDSHLFVDGSNTPHLLLSGPGALEECWPRADGTWTSRTILAGPSLDAVSHLAALSTGADSAWLLATSSPQGSAGPATLLGLPMVGGTWLAAPQQIYAMPVPSFPFCVGMAQAPDGSRAAALLTDAGVGLVVLVWSGTDWIPTLVAPPEIQGVGVAFDALGRLHVLAFDPSLLRLRDFHE